MQVTSSEISHDFGDLDVQFTVVQAGPGIKQMVTAAAAGPMTALCAATIPDCSIRLEPGSRLLFVASANGFNDGLRLDGTYVRELSFHTLHRSIDFNFSHSLSLSQ